MNESIGGSDEQSFNHHKYNFLDPNLMTNNFKDKESYRKEY